MALGSISQVVKTTLMNMARHSSMLIVYYWDNVGDKNVISKEISIVECCGVVGERKVPYMNVPLIHLE